MKENQLPYFTFIGFDKSFNKVIHKKVLKNTK